MKCKVKSRVGRKFVFGKVSRNSNTVLGPIHVVKGFYAVCPYKTSKSSVLLLVEFAYLCNFEAISIILLIKCFFLTIIIIKFFLKNHTLSSPSAGPGHPRAETHSQRAAKQTARQTPG